MFTQRMAIGPDVHARSIRAAAIDTHTGEVLEARFPGGNTPVTTWITGIAVEHGPVHVVYEAGPAGFSLARTIDQRGIPVTVAAPSKLIRPVGDNAKTDARDALLLARLLKLDELVFVRVPTTSEESARDLVRARDDARVELMMVRHRLSKLLLGHNLVYPGSVTWGSTHEAWLRRVRKDELVSAGSGGALAAFDAAFDAVTLGRARRDRLDQQLNEMAAQSEFTPVTNRLCCLHEINTLTGFALAVEIGDWHRFTGRTIAAYLGLGPSEHSSGTSRSQGGITKTGNTHARRLLVEATWHHKPRYSPGKTMTGPVGQSSGSGGCTRRRREPEIQPAVGCFLCAQEEAHRCVYRDRA